MDERIALVGNLVGEINWSCCILIEIEEVAVSYLRNLWRCVLKNKIFGNL